MSYAALPSQFYLIINPL